MFQSNAKKLIQFEDIEQKQLDWAISMGSGTSGYLTIIYLKRSDRLQEKTVSMKARYQPLT